MTVLDVMREAGTAFGGGWHAALAAFLKGLLVFGVVPSMMFVVLWAARDQRLYLLQRMKMHAGNRNMRHVVRLLTEPVMDAGLVASMLVFFAFGVTELVAMLVPFTPAVHAEVSMFVLADSLLTHFEGLMAVPLGHFSWGEIWSGLEGYHAELWRAKPHDMAPLMAEWAARWAIVGAVIRLYWAPFAFTLDMLRLWRLGPLPRPAA